MRHTLFNLDKLLTKELKCSFFLYLCEQTELIICYKDNRMELKYMKLNSQSQHGTCVPFFLLISVLYTLIFTAQIVIIKNTLKQTIRVI